MASFQVLLKSLLLVSNLTLLFSHHSLLLNSLGVLSLLLSLNFQLLFCSLTLHFVSELDSFSSWFESKFTPLLWGFFIWACFSLMMMIITFAWDIWPSFSYLNVRNLSFLYLIGTACLLLCERSDHLFGICHLLAVHFLEFFDRLLQKLQLRRILDCFFLHFF